MLLDGFSRPLWESRLASFAFSTDSPGKWTYGSCCNEHMFVGQVTYVRGPSNICSWADEHMFVKCCKKHPLTTLWRPQDKNVVPLQANSQRGCRDVNSFRIL